MRAADNRRIGQAIGRRLGIEVQAAGGRKLRVNVNCKKCTRSDRIWRRLMKEGSLYKFLHRIIMKTLDMYALEYASDSQSVNMYNEFADCLTANISVKYIRDDVCLDKPSLVSE